MKINSKALTFTEKSKPDSNTTLIAKYLLVMTKPKFKADSLAIQIRKGKLIFGSRLEMSWNSRNLHKIIVCFFKQMK